MHHLKLILPLILLAFFSNAFALATDKDQPIELAADSVDVDNGKGLSIYKGNVDLIQGSMRLQANKVMVQQRNGKADKIIAIGSPVKFQQKSGKGLVKASAKRTEYTVNSEVLLLIGNASLIQSGSTINSDRITYDRVKHKIKAGAAAKGKQRVRITIPK